ncbi:MAG: hypothetical protein QXD23_03355, partial [Candidatus Micrarchaeaceae archaeon]
TFENLSPIPINNGEFAIAPDMFEDIPISHPVKLAPIYPCGLVTCMGPTNLIPIAEQTLKNLWRCGSRITSGGNPQRFHWNDDLSMGWIGVARAWMGDGSGALDAVLNGWVAGCLKTNGFLTSQARTPEARIKMDWMQNQLSGVANVINEMLMQSHSGIIHIFPAIPKTWKNVSFGHLRAIGAFLISAAQIRGVIQWVAIEALKDGICRVKNPWQAKKIAVWKTNPQPAEKSIIVISDKNDCFEFNLKAQETIVLSEEGKNIQKIRIQNRRNKNFNPWAQKFPALVIPKNGDKTWVCWWGKSDGKK